MKKIFLFILVFISLKAFSQFPVQQSQGTSKTQVYSRGGYGADSGFVFRYSFPDTATANNGFLKNIPGIQILVGNFLFIRNQTVNAWLSAGAVDISGKLNISDTAAMLFPAYVRQSRTLNINGVEQDLTANRTWNVGTLVGADTASLSNRINFKVDTVYRVNDSTIAQVINGRVTTFEIKGSVQGGGGGASGLTSLNTLTDAAQTFAFNQTGLTPGVTSASSVHTFHHPLASAAGVTNGGITKLEYDIFNNKQPAGDYITGIFNDVLASGPGLVSATIQPNVVSDSKLRQSAGLSLIGRSANSTGNVADITAALDHQVLRRSGTSIGFGAVNLSSTNAVTGTLTTANIDTSVSVLGVATQYDLLSARSKLSRTFQLSNDSLKMSYEANVRDYGAVGDGTTNDYTAIAAAVATGKTIYFPPGTYYVNPPTTNGIQLQAGQRIYGEGNLSTLKITTDEVIIFTNDDNIIENLRFLGSGKNTASLPLQSGVMSYQRKRSIVKSCWFEGFAGDGTNTRYGGAISVANVNATTPFYNGISVSDCKFIENNIGLYLGLQGEYCTISNSLFGQNNTGAVITAGNYTLSNNHFVQNTLGIRIDSQFNSGHGTITGGSFNHNTKMFELNNLDVGHTFSGVMFYYGDASITDCIAIKFIGCDIWGSGGNDVWTLTNSRQLVISNSKFTRNNVLHGYMVVTVVSGETFAYANNTEVSQN